MKKVFNCTRENPLHEQLASLDRHLIEEIAVKGFLCDEDYELLTEMSGENGNLKQINLYEVDETSCCFAGQVGIADDAFMDSIKLEQIILPKSLNVIGSPAFCGCVNLRDIDFPESLISIGTCAFQDCPKLGEIYIGKKLKLGDIVDYSFAGSASSFICDFNQWPLNEKGEPVVECKESGYFSHDGVLFYGWELEKYPSNHERSIYIVPSGTYSIENGAFMVCKNLHKIVFPESCETFTSGAIFDCPELETLVFKSQIIDGMKVHHMDDLWENVITRCPKLRDIYLYAEDPSKISFGVFNDLCLSDIVLHVPCFCAEKYRQREEAFFKFFTPRRTYTYIKCWQKFKRIEEFDPNNFV